MTVLIAAMVPSGCSSREDTPRNVMIGHWQNVGTKHVADNPNYKSTSDNRGGDHIYVSETEAWRVEPGEAPARVAYEVVEENIQEFWLDMCVTTGAGTKIYSRVTFSPDRKEMYVATRLGDPGEGLPPDIASTVRSQLGGSTSTTTYKRVDDETRPTI